MNRTTNPVTIKLKVDEFSCADPTAIDFTVTVPTSYDFEFDTTLTPIALPAGLDFKFTTSNGSLDTRACLAHTRSDYVWSIVATSSAISVNYDKQASAPTHINFAWSDITRANHNVKEVVSLRIIKKSTD